MTDREGIIRQLCAERGSWGDGTVATEESILDAAARPWAYDINEATLDAASEGDVQAIIELRAAWLLPSL